MPLHQEARACEEDVRVRSRGGLLGVSCRSEAEGSKRSLKAEDADECASEGKVIGGSLWGGRRTKGR